MFYLQLLTIRYLKVLFSPRKQNRLAKLFRQKASFEMMVQIPIGVTLSLKYFSWPCWAFIWWKKALPRMCCHFSLDVAFFSKYLLLGDKGHVQKSRHIGFVLRAILSSPPLCSARPAELEHIGGRQGPEKAPSSDLTNQASETWGAQLVNGRRQWLWGPTSVSVLRWRRGDLCFYRKGMWKDGLNIGFLPLFCLPFGSWSFSPRWGPWGPR